ncbi:MAG: iron-sulfur cluster-binding protein [Acidobacteriaceae bacterium]|nr:iron-sulfur cluster-binding protein [Acidobacteriaceae bacterium]
MNRYVRSAAEAKPFPEAAHQALEDSQLRRNVRNATNIIQAKRNAMVAEMPDWEDLRNAGHAIKTHTLKYLDLYLEDFERNVTKAGGQVHWARNAEEANGIITEIIGDHAGDEVIKVKTMTSHETHLNTYLEEHGITPHETDLADLIVQLGNDSGSHIVVPALHINRVQIREIFERRMPLAEIGMDSLSDDPQQLAETARRYLRQKFLGVKIGVSGANFAVADAGAVVIVESEGNARMCVTLPDVLITLVGIEKLVPTFQDLEVFLQTLARSATGERMNPYTSIWTGVTPGDGPQEFHVVLLDNGRTGVLADSERRETLNCIRCGACLNVCPVYHHTGGHAYGSVYQGPIGAILTPQLENLQHARTLPFASSLCGACYDVCPVKINIPEILISLRGEIARSQQNSLAGRLHPENIAMHAMALVFSSSGLLNFSEALARIAQRPFVRKGVINHLPGPLSGWTATRDLMPLARQSFRQWWSKNRRASDQ